MTMQEHYVVDLELAEVLAFLLDSCNTLMQVCSETLIGNDQVRGVSGGQRKRVTTGELLVSPKKTLFLDEISTGLDSNTTFQIMRTLRHFAHLRQATMLIALLQPTPETYHLFDDIMLLSEGTVHLLSQQTIRFHQPCELCCISSASCCSCNEAALQGYLFCSCLFT